MNNRIANDLIRYAELVEDSALISPEEMNCASLMRLAAEALAQPEQEPLCTAAMLDDAFWAKSGLSPDTKLYTTPPQPKEPEQEPVAIYQLQKSDGSWIDQDKGSYRYNSQHGHTVRIVYTTTPQRKPLTDDELMIALLHVDGEAKRLPIGFRSFARAIEAAHGIKGDA